jgi:uncharacterized protein (TIGR03437 family)
VFVSSNTGEVWVTDASGNAVRKYPRYDTLIFNPTALVAIPSVSPIAVTQDQYGDLIVAEAYNRVTFYYPALAAVNLAMASNQGNKALAPNTMATIYPQGIQFGKDSADAFSLPNPLPLPTTLADIQVTVNGTPAPLYYVSPTQINIIVPWSAPTSGTADVQVLKKSTGQLLAASPVQMNIASPAIFANVQAGVGVRQAAVINADGNINSSTHPARPGEYIQIWGTGQGPVANPPADGDIPHNGLVWSQGNLRVIIGADYTDQIPLQGSEQRNMNGDVNFIQFYGLSPSFPGMWQVNVRIPMATAAGQQPIGLMLNSIPDNQPAVTGYRNIFYVTTAK